MSKPFAVRVYDGPRPIRAWTIYARDLEEAKAEAERAVALDWPMKEFSVTPGKGHR